MAEIHGKYVPTFATLEVLGFQQHRGTHAAYEDSDLGGAKTFVQTEDTMVTMTVRFPGGEPFLVSFSSKAGVSELMKAALAKPGTG